MRTRRRWIGLLALAVLAPLMGAGSGSAATPQPTVALPSIGGPVSATASAQRVHRVIPHPADAVCVDPARAAADPVGVLQDLMAGRLGPLGWYGSSDIGGATNIGGPRQWIFALGDTLLGPNDGVTMPGGMTWVNNAFLVQDDNCFWVEWGGRAAGTAPTSLIQASAGTWYWTSDAYVVGDTMYQFVTQIRPTGGAGIFDFEVFDTDLAVIDLGHWDLEHATIIEHGPWEQLDADYLEGVFDVEANGGVVLGVVTHGRPDEYGMVRLTDPADPLAPWQAWDGSGWGPLSSMVPVSIRKPGDSSGVRPFEYRGTWYAMGWSWTLATGVTYWVERADAMTGPYEEISRSPITLLPGQSPETFQYWHTLEGRYTLGDGVVLMEWANHGDFSEGAPLRLIRPAFTRFHLATLTADPVT